VSMRPMHWREVNGFSNGYQGWGAEDDDLYVRLKRARLLKGSNHRQILRPLKGHGIFNHTEKSDRIPVENAMKHNHSSYSMSLKLLKKMIRGRRSKWRSDGINSVKYNVLSRNHTSFKNSRLSRLEIIHVTQV
jgi:N-terminal domain of galactosyltransferase